MRRAEFEMHTAVDSRPVEVTLTGEVDASNVVGFDQSVREIPGGRPIILDLSSAKYLDSAGFSALDKLLADNEIVIVLAPTSFMFRVAELMCLPIHHDVEAARHVLSSGAD